MLTLGPQSPDRSPGVFGYRLEIPNRVIRELQWEHLAALLQEEARDGHARARDRALRHGHGRRHRPLPRAVPRGRVDAGGALAARERAAPPPHRDAAVAAGRRGALPGAVSRDAVAGAIGPVRIRRLDALVHSFAPPVGGRLPRAELPDLVTVELNRIRATSPD